MNVTFDDDIVYTDATVVIIAFDELFATWIAKIVLFTLACYAVAFYLRIGMGKTTNLELLVGLQPPNLHLHCVFFAADYLEHSP